MTFPSTVSMDSSSQGVFATRPISRTRATGAVNRRLRREFEVFQDPSESSGRVNGQAAHVEIRVVSEQSRKRPRLGDISINANSGSRRQVPPAASNGAKRGPKPGQRWRRLPSSTTRPATNRPPPTNVTVQPTRRSARLRNRPPRPSQSAPEEDHPDPEDALVDELAEGFVPLSQVLEEQEEEDDFHQRNDDEPSSRSLQRPCRRRERGRGRARRHGRRLGELHMVARKPNPSVELYTLPPLHVDENVCPHCKAYQYPEEYQRTNNQKYWPCCSNGKVPVDRMSAENDPEGLAAMPEVTEEQRRDKARIQIREDAVRKEIHDRLHEVEEYEPDKFRLSKRCREFHDQLLNYNNVLSVSGTLDKHLCNLKIENEPSSCSTSMSISVERRVDC